ncbi:MAG: chromosomal replication initiator protein DnaA [Candidatus Paceibacterota bacterium]
MLETKKLWESVLVDMELSVSKANFSTWFKNTSIIKIEDGVVSVAVPNEFVKDWLINKFHKLILKSLRNLSESTRSIEYIVIKDINNKKEFEEKPKYLANLSTNTLPLNDFYINKDDNLNPKYTFENFVVGPFNELAFAASQAIIKKPGIAYNPLFIFGSTGHGKTHLIQAIGNALKHSNKDIKIFYATSEKFSVDYVTSLQTNKVNFFKEKYRKYDVLIMDDIQFLSGKEKIQEELFHLFNTLYDNNKQIVFSSDKHVNYIPNLEERLKSRFGAGMIVEIPQPDQESRIAILKTKAQFHNFPLSHEMCDYLASAIEGNIRELESIINAIMCQSQIKNRELSLLEVKHLIKDSAKPKKNVSIKDIIKIVADYYKIDEESIYEKTRRKEVVRPRQLIMYILREDFSVSYPTIGQKLGGRDHTTVIHSCEKIKNDIKTDPTLQQEINKIRSMI